MRIFIIILGLAISIIGLYQRDSWRWAASTLLALFILAAIAEIIISIKEANEGRKSVFSGILKTKKTFLMLFKKDVWPEMELGDSGSIISLRSQQGLSAIHVFKSVDLTIWLENGCIRVSTKVKNKNGLVAELINNEWKVNQNNSFDRNYSKNELEVKDKEGDIILQIKLKSNRVQFQGKFYEYEEGKSLAIGKGNHKGQVVGCIELTGFNHPKLLMKIEPLFKYPSELHLGEHF